MINSYHILKEFIATDLSRIIEREPTIWDGIVYYFRPQGSTFPYVFWLRIVQYLKCKQRWMALLPYLRLRHFEFKYGIHTNSNIDIGKGLLIVHGGAVYINCKSIGENFTIYQGVTLGSKKYGSDYKGAIPTVANNVTICTGAVVCGDIIIGDFARIGANTYVSKSVSEGMTIIGADSRII